MIYITNSIQLTTEHKCNIVVGKNPAHEYSNEPSVGIYGYRLLVFSEGLSVENFTTDRTANSNSIQIDIPDGTTYYGLINIIDQQETNSLGFLTKFIVEDIKFSPHNASANNQASSVIFGSDVLYSEIALVEISGFTITFGGSPISGGNMFGSTGYTNNGGSIFSRVIIKCDISSGNYLCSETTNVELNHIEMRDKNGIRPSSLSTVSIIGTAHDTTSINYSIVHNSQIITNTNGSINFFGCLLYYQNSNKIIENLNHFTILMNGTASTSSNVTFTNTIIIRETNGPLFGTIRLPDDAGLTIDFSHVYVAYVDGGSFVAVDRLISTSLEIDGEGTSYYISLSLVNFYSKFDGFTNFTGSDTNVAINVNSMTYGGPSSINDEYLIDNLYTNANDLYDFFENSTNSLPILYPFLSDYYNQPNDINYSITLGAQLDITLPSLNLNRIVGYHIVQSEADLVAISGTTHYNDIDVYFVNDVQLTQITPFDLITKGNCNVVVQSYPERRTITLPLELSSYSGIFNCSSNHEYSQFNFSNILINANGTTASSVLLSGATPSIYNISRITVQNATITASGSVLYVGDASNRLGTHIATSTIDRCITANCTGDTSSSFIGYVNYTRITNCYIKSGELGCVAYNIGYNTYFNGCYAHNARLFALSSGSFNISRCFVHRDSSLSSGICGTIIYDTDFLTGTYTNNIEDSYIVHSGTNNFAGIVNLIVANSGSEPNLYISNTYFYSTSSNKYAVSFNYIGNDQFQLEFDNYYTNDDCIVLNGSNYNDYISLLLGSVNGQTINLNDSISDKATTIATGLSNCNISSEFVFSPIFSHTSFIKEDTDSLPKLVYFTENTVGMSWSTYTNSLSAPIFPELTISTNVYDDPHINPLYGEEYTLPHDEKTYLLYDNNEEDRFIIKGKTWFIPMENAIEHLGSLIRDGDIDNHKEIMSRIDNSTYFKYIKFEYNGNILIMDMENLMTVKFTNYRDLVNNCLPHSDIYNDCFKLSEIENSETCIRFNKLDKKTIGIKSRTVAIDKYKIELVCNYGEIKGNNGIKLGIPETDLNAKGALVRRNDVESVGF